MIDSAKCAAESADLQRLAAGTIFVRDTHAAIHVTCSTYGGLIVDGKPHFFG